MFRYQRVQSNCHPFLGEIRLFCWGIPHFDSFLLVQTPQFLCLKPHFWWQHPNSCRWTPQFCGFTHHFWWLSHEITIFKIIRFLLVKTNAIFEGYIDISFSCWNQPHVFSWWSSYIRSSNIFIYVQLNSSHGFLDDHGFFLSKTVGFVNPPTKRQGGGLWSWLVLAEIRLVSWGNLGGWSAFLHLPKEKGMIYDWLVVSNFFF